MAEWKLNLFTSGTKLRLAVNSIGVIIISWGRRSLYFTVSPFAVKPFFCVWTLLFLFTGFLYIYFRQWCSKYFECNASFPEAIHPERAKWTTPITKIPKKPTWVTIIHAKYIYSWRMLVYGVPIENDIFIYLLLLCLPRSTLFI